MTKDRSGRLTIPLSSGEHNILVQHRQGFHKTAGFGGGRLLLPQLEVPTSRTNVTMTYPAEWIPLYESFATRSQLWTPDSALLLLFAAVALWIERLLAWLELPLRRRLFYAAVGALAATIVFTFLVLMLVACSALTIAWMTTLSLRARIGAAVALLFCGIFVLFVMTVSNVSSRKFESSSEYEVSRSMPTDTMATTTAAQNAGAKTNGPVEQQQASYQGLPAKFDLPGGSRYTSFQQELLPSDRRQAVFVFAVSMLLVKWIGVVLALITIALLARDFHVLAAALRERVPLRRSEIAPA
jgi:hypothetical protein